MQSSVESYVAEFDRRGMLTLRRAERSEEKRWQIKREKLEGEVAIVGEGSLISVSRVQRCTVHTCKGTCSPRLV